MDSAMFGNRHDTQRKGKDMITVIATSVLKPGCREKFIELTKANYANVLAEKGCISYVLNENMPSGMAAQCQLPADTLVFVECWESLEALKAHLAAPHMEAFREAVTPMRLSSELRIVTPV